MKTGQLRVSPDFVTTSGGRHMDKAKEETLNEGGMLIKKAWQSIGTFSIFAITHIAISFWAHPREYIRAMSSAWQRSMAM
ncbi:hypothetical protein Y032_0003g1488 [Ancylostoma ceylanicum]|uniref:Uncharacterized protein n=1 Tax=Ancylostoma ceylanicum TaxID=53326 RepID=A0A016VXD5_9BILA|nr:hypothetical protein Y032_0003g1488 [Ancylostoma ceylanicum]